MHEIPFISLQPDRRTKLRQHLAHVNDGLRPGLIALMQFLEQQTRQLQSLSELYPQLRHVHEDIIGTYARVPEHWEHNERLLYHLLAPFSFRYCLANGASNEDPQTGRGNGFEFMVHDHHDANDHPGYESVTQVLHHLMRDYSERAEETRRKLYHPILAYLSQYLSDGPDASTDNHNVTKNVLVPGAGMGRLVLEIAAHTPPDVAVEANECSLTMITAMQNMFNKLLLPDSEAVTVFPNLHATGIDEFSHRDRLQGYSIPDSCAKQLVAEDSVRKKISVEFGDFTAIYGNPFRPLSYHAVVTCFFIDTATNVLEYIAVIGRLLSANRGIWINAGPLHYHSQSAIRYSLESLSVVISSSGFTLLEQTQVTTTYCGEEKISMKPELYQVPIQVWKLTDPPKVLNIAKEHV